MRVLIIGDMNARVGDSKVEGVVDKFGASGSDENERKLIELCAEKKWSVGNTHFEKKEIHKFSCVGEVDGHKRLLDFIVV